MEGTELLIKLGEPLPIEGRQQTDGKKTFKFYDTDGYGYQYCVNRFNELMGHDWGFRWEILHAEQGNTSKGKPRYEIVVKIGIWVIDQQNIRECVGGHTSETYTDALKGAITSGFKKTAAFWGVGRHAYEGSIDRAYVDDDNRPYPEGWDDNNKSSIQTPKTNGNGHSTNDNNKTLGITITMLFTQFGKLSLGKEYTTELYKAYCYNKYLVSSMKDLSQEDIIDQNKILGAMRNDPTWIPDFKKKLDSFRSQPENQPTESQTLTKSIVDRLTKIYGQDTEKIGYILSRMCTEVSHPGDLSKLTLAQLKTISELVDVKLNETKEEVAA